MLETTKKYINQRRTEVPKYGLLYFDHLQGEFLLEEGVTESDNRIRQDIETKRKERMLTWNEIYAYQLILLKYQDFETLRSKIISLRIKYQNLTSIAEYNEYKASRAVELDEVSNTEVDTAKLRADYKYLLDEFYLRYAYVSTHEDLRTKLLRYGAAFTLGFLVLAIVVGVIAMNKNLEMVNQGSFIGYMVGLKNYFSTLFIVIFAGIMGAFVSMQQRLQTVSNQGDPIYSLSLLTHGWFSIFLSPISGAIFAALLYLFFAGGLLEGSVFPEMTTYTKEEVRQRAGISETQPQESQEKLTTNPPEPEKPVSQPTKSPSSDETEKSPSVGITDFALKTGPTNGKSFALLIIWSFIAGFAERFVPDTLMRLVNQKKASETATA